MTETDERRERQQEFLSALGKVLLVAIAIGAAIGLGTYVVVNSLGLDETEIGTVGGPAPATPVQPLPSTALPVPTDIPDEPTPTGIVTEPTPGEPGGDGLTLSASPVFVKAMERINLTGRWPGQDAMGLMVQRLEDGEWVDFGVRATLKVGTFDTYVLTGREGDNVFRVFDPETNTASNEVTVTVE